MNKNMIIFDFDGPLSNSAPDYFNWVTFWAEQTNFKLSKQATTFDGFRDIYSTGYNRGSLKELYDEFGFPDAQTVLQFSPPSPINQAYLKYFKEHSSSLQSGVSDLLYSLKSNYTLALLTTNFEPIVKPILNNHFDLFDIHIFGNHKDGTEKIKKPDYRAIEVIVDSLDFKPELIYHIGDQTAELLTTENFKSVHPDINIKTIGVSYGFSPRNFLERGINLNGTKRYFDDVVDSVKELKDYLLSRDI